MDNVLFFGRHDLICSYRPIIFLPDFDIEQRNIEQQMNFARLDETELLPDSGKLLPDDLLCVDSE